MTLPITLQQAKIAAAWMKANFASEMAAAAPASPIDSNLLCAIACQEAACYWLGWIDHYPPDVVIQHCVFDASGDASGHPRTAFPVNTAAFRAQYGDSFTSMLIAEANIMRQMRGMAPASWVYKGYGIFQYDLQFVLSDRGFFENRLWRNFSECAKRAAKELAANYARYGDLRTAVRAYNGTGPSAEAYADNVMAFLTACQSVGAPGVALAAATAAAQYPAHPIKSGEADHALVSAIQAGLSAQGYGRFAAGTFDDTMSSVVKLFQSQHVDREGRPLDSDGIIGPLTWAAIFGAASAPAPIAGATSALLTKTVQIAHGEIGVMEQPPGSNRGPRVDVYLQSVGIAPNQGTADDRYWCMAFAYFCVNSAAAELGVPNPLARTAGVLDQWNKCQGHAGIRLITKAEAMADPTVVRPGQLLILDHGGGLGHTGIVSAADGPHLTVIEGNSSGRPNDRNGVGVFLTAFRKIQDNELKGFIDYDIR